MHPNAYLQTYWQLDLKPEIFVAMSFSDEYEARYIQVIKPAIETIELNGVKLSATRVDISKTGDSILTSILDGIAHSQMVLADVSVLGNDSKSGKPYRNGNVMYEVGLALACRQSQEVLLVRDDKAPFLFDVSTTPHMHIDFTDIQSSRNLLHEELKARLTERNYFNDARVNMAIKQLSAEEVAYLKSIFEYGKDKIWGGKLKGLASWTSIAVPRLLDKNIIQFFGQFENGFSAFRFTDLGWIVKERLKLIVDEYSFPTPSDEVENE